MAKNNNQYLLVSLQFELKEMSAYPKSQGGRFCLTLLGPINLVIVEKSKENRRAFTRNKIVSKKINEKLEV